MKCLNNKELKEAVWGRAAVRRSLNNKELKEYWTAQGLKESSLNNKELKVVHLPSSPVLAVLITKN